MQTLRQIPGAVLESLDNHNDRDARKPFWQILDRPAMRWAYSTQQLIYSTVLLQPYSGEAYGALQCRTVVMDLIRMHRM